MESKKMSKKFISRNTIASILILVVTILNIYTNNFYIDVIKLQTANSSDIGVINLSLLKSQLRCSNKNISEYCNEILSIKDESTIQASLNKLKEVDKTVE